MAIIAREDEEEEENNREKKKIEVLQIDSNPDISSLVDQDVKQQADADRPEAEGGGSLLGKRDRPEPVADVEVIRAQPEVESGIQILAGDSPGVAQIEDQKKSTRIKKVEVEEADPTYPTKVVRRKLKKLAKEQAPDTGESKVLEALAQPDLRVQKEKKRPSKVPPEAGQPCNACGSSIKPNSIYSRLWRANEDVKRLKKELLIAGQTKQGQEKTIKKLE
jgi:hypothetical protein